jgi:carbohydrate-selective porin OprB
VRNNKCKKKRWGRVRECFAGAGITVGPDEPGISDFSVFGTVEATGYFASRPKDKIGVGGFYNDLASALTDSAALLGQNLPDNNTLRDNTSGFEAYYNAELTRWFHLSGNLQLVNSATPGTSTSVIPSVRAVIEF